MPLGLVTAAANSVLDTLLTGTTYLKLHTASPGVGATAASAETTRKALTFAAAGSGSKAANGTLPSWTSWSAGTETITHFSIWDAVSGGNCLATGAFGTGRTVHNGDTFALTSLSAAVSTLAS
jgi:hypothetical protein